MAVSFVVKAMIRGYHEYRSIWENPAHGEQLSCARKPRNPSDPMAVAVQKSIISGEITTVGHMPRKISALCSIFLRRGGEIKCIVNGH